LNRESVDISNYEEWVVDRLDGRLSESEVAQLDAFLLAHPELDVDLEELQEMSLAPVSEVFEPKTALKRVSQEMEDDIIKYVETAECSTALKMAMDANDESVIRELDRYRTVKLKPSTAISRTLKNELSYEGEMILEGDATIVFSDKASLKYEEGLTLLADTSIVYPHKKDLKQKEGGLVIPMTFVKWAVAASIAVLAGLFFFQANDQGYVPREGLSSLPTLEETQDYLGPINEPIQSKSLADTEVIVPVIDSPSSQEETKDSRDQERINRPIEVNQFATVTPPSAITPEKVIAKGQKAPLRPAVDNEGIANDIAPDAPKEPAPSTLIVKDPIEEEGIAEAPAVGQNNAEVLIADAPIVDRTPTVVEYLKGETAEQLTGDKTERIRTLDIIQKVSENTDIIAMNSNHRDEKAGRTRFNIKVGSFGFSRSKSRQ